MEGKLRESDRVGKLEGEAAQLQNKLEVQALAEKIESLEDEYARLKEEASAKDAIIAALRKRVSNCSLSKSVTVESGIFKKNLKKIRDTVWSGNPEKPFRGPGPAHTCCEIRSMVFRLLSITRIILL